MVYVVTTKPQATLAQKEVIIQWSEEQRRKGSRQTTVIYNYTS